MITRPDAPRGRKRVLTPSPVAAAAQELGIDTLKTARRYVAFTPLVRLIEKLEQEHAPKFGYTF